MNPTNKNPNGTNKAKNEMNNIKPKTVLNISIIFGYYLELIISVFQFLEFLFFLF